MKDQDGNNFVAYFMPTEETLQQKLVEEAEGLNYTPEHEYVLNILVPVVNLSDTNMFVAVNTTGLFKQDNLMAPMLKLISSPKGMVACIIVK